MGPFPCGQQFERKTDGPIDRTATEGSIRPADSSQGGRFYHPLCTNRTRATPAGANKKNVFLSPALENFRCHPLTVRAPELCGWRT